MKLSDFKFIFLIDNEGLEHAFTSKKSKEKLYLGAISILMEEQGNTADFYVYLGENYGKFDRKKIDIRLSP